MPALDLSQRSRRYELIDSPSVGYADMKRCFRHIEAVNGLTGGNRPVMAWLSSVLRDTDSQRRLEILDIGCGGGDGLRRIWKWARRHKRQVELTGIDINPHARQIARESTPLKAPVKYVTGDIFAYEPDEDFDLMTATLFMHHLSDDEIVRLLRWMCAHSREGWCINDLHRHWLPYYFIKYALALTRFDPMVRHDAPVSVARGFTARDWARLLARADIPAGEVAIRWYFPFRYGVIWRRPRK